MPGKKEHRKKIVRRGRGKADTFAPPVPEQDSEGTVMAEPGTAAAAQTRKRKVQKKPRWRSFWPENIPDNCFAHNVNVESELDRAAEIILNMYIPPLRYKLCFLQPRYTWSRPELQSAGHASL